MPSFKFVVFLLFSVLKNKRTAACTRKIEMENPGIPDGTVRSSSSRSDCWGRIAKLFAMSKITDSPTVQDRCQALGLLEPLNTSATPALASRFSDEEDVCSSLLGDCSSNLTVHVCFVIGNISASRICRSPSRRPLKRLHPGELVPHLVVRQKHFAFCRNSVRPISFVVASES